MAPATDAEDRFDEVCREDLSFFLKWTKVFLSNLVQLDEVQRLADFAQQHADEL